MRRKCFNILVEKVTSKGYAQRKGECGCENEFQCLVSQRMLPSPGRIT